MDFAPKTKERHGRVLRREATGREVEPGGKETSFTGDKVRGSEALGVVWRLGSIGGRMGNGGLCGCGRDGVGGKDIRHDSVLKVWGFLSLYGEP